MSQTNLFGDQAPPEPEEGAVAGALPVLVAAPVERAYDYAAPAGVELRPGDYVLVPFGGRQIPGVVRARADGEGGAPPKKIKAALKKYDLPPMPPVHLAFLDWVAAYTMTPPGAVLKMALSVPAALEPPDGATAYRIAAGPGVSADTPLLDPPPFQGGGEEAQGEGNAAENPCPLPRGEAGRGVKAARQKRTSVRARQDWIMTRDRARDLRKDMTAAEETLWRHLRGKAMDGARFRKQYPVPPYIADFACPEGRVIVEVDGSQHGGQPGCDAERTAFLERAGYRVLRVWNNDITGNIDGVLEAIWRAVREGAADVSDSDPPPSGFRQTPPPLTGGRTQQTNPLPPVKGGCREGGRESENTSSAGLDFGTPTLSPARRKVLEVMADGRARRAAEIAELAGCGAGVVRGMAEKGLLESVTLHAPAPCAAPDPERHGPSLSPDQQGAADTLKGYLKSGAYHASLLDGVTGAGKTEVYFEAVAQCIRTGRQALVLLPEIALSNAFLDRFRARFGCAPALWHSQLTTAQRRDTWRAVAEGRTKVVVGARSALFLPYAALGLIVVDEEHDPAYKQEEGAIYHARDMAIVRANMGKIPIVLVSATPSLETMQNVRDGRYALLHLPDRFGGASLPDIKIVDLRKDKPSRQNFISPVLKVAVEETLKAGEQALLFLNRRGYAPLTLCRSCGHRMECPRCTAWLVEHRSDHSLRCHHCGYGMPVPGACPSCNDADSFAACGPGVERIREEAESLFPEARISVLASDTAEGPERLRAMLADIREHKVDIVIGTQIIAKGHHFPGLTCVGVIDADLGLAGGDLRATERTYQMLHQVAGRAGREAKKGTVYLQTWNPDSRVMQALAAGDRDRFLEAEACEREAARMPPFTRLAGIIVSGRNDGQTIETARELGRTAPHGPGIETLGPAPAPLARLRGKFRYRLLVVADKNLNLQKAVAHWLAQVKVPSAVRVQVDIDPQSFL